MNKRQLIVLTIAVVALVLVAAKLTLFWKEGPAPDGSPTAPPLGEGWVDLLDADHAPLWKNVGDEKEIFAIEGGIVHIFGRSTHPLRYVTYTGEQFADFELHIEFKVTWRANSGVFLRTQPNDPVNRGFEIQVLDDHGQAPNKNGSGSIYDVVSPMFNLARPRGEWNSYDVRVQGHEVSITMNGWLVVQTDFSKMTSPLGKFKIPYAEMKQDGSLALQDHGGEVWYRNIRIRKL